MSIYPELIAGYEAAVQALAEHAVHIKDPRVLTTFSTDPMEMLAAGPAAYSVYAVLRRDSIYLERTGRFGFEEEDVVVDFPVPYDAPDFAERFAAVLVPVAEELLLRAMKQSHEERSALKPDEPAEAWEAVQKVSE